MSQKNISVLITGRGNNTLPDKNVIDILGKPLLQYGAIAGKSIKRSQSFFVSSENEKILLAAEECGYQRIQRPEEYSKPDAQHVDCLIHALETMKAEHSVEPEILVVILANCATIKAEWIDDCIDLLLENTEATSAIPVQKNNDHHPLRAKRIDESGFLAPFSNTLSQPVSSNRQDLDPNFFVCHNFWVLNLNNMKSDLSLGHPPWPFMGDKVIPYEVDYSLDIHHPEDIYLTELWLKSNGWKERLS